MNVNVDCKKFTCPICFLLPGNEIFQCKNCHILCDKCIAPLHQCPQCRASFQGDGKSRNRALEEILDDLKIDCPFSDHGCMRKLGRSELSSHRSSCTFGKELFLCRIIGIQCNFKATFANARELADHLETAHQTRAFTACNEGRVSIKLPTVFDGIGNNGTWDRIIQFQKPRGKILLFMYVREKYMSWVVLDFSTVKKSGRTYAEISSEETPSISWKVPVYHVMEAEERIRNPVNKTYMPCLEEQRRGGTPGATKSVDYVVNIKITDTD